jgi:RHS repeat-associated protein
MIDQNGTADAYSYTALGLPYTSTAYSNTVGGTVVNQVADEYNGLGQLTQEYQSDSGAVDTSTTPSVQYSYNLMAGGANNSNLLSITYPDGRILDYDYGSGQEPVTAISVSGTTATVTTAVPNGLSTGALILIGGSSQQTLDGSFTVTVANSTTFTYTFTGSASSDSSADLTETPVSLDTLIGRPDGLQDQAGSAAGTVLAGYSYLGFGTVVQTAYGNGVDLSYIERSGDSSAITSGPRYGGDEYTGLDPFGRVIEAIYSYNALGERVTSNQTAADDVGPVAVVNNGSPQRSMVDSLTVIFPSAVTLSSGAITLYNTTGSYAESISYTNPSGDGKTWLVSFTGTDIHAGSLPNGVFDLVVHHADVSGITLSSDVTWAFHRLFGDINGDGAVTLADYNVFAEDYDSDYYGAQYDPAFDYDADGRDFNTDYDAFVGDVHTTETYTPTGAPFLTVPITGSTVLQDCSPWTNVTNDLYYSNQGQVLETHANGTVTTQSVWGLDYVNDLVAYDTNSTSGSLGVTGSGLGQRLYAQHDANYDVTALTNTSGAVLERYEYTPYGTVTVLNPDGTVLGDGTMASSQFGVPYLFQGMRYDSFTGLYETPNRDLNPATGTWLQADPAGYVDGSSLYQFVGSSPADLVDPTGLAANPPPTPPPTPKPKPKPKPTTNTSSGGVNTNFPTLPGDVGGAATGPAAPGGSSANGGSGAPGNGANPSALPSTPAPAGGSPPGPYNNTMNSGQGDNAKANSAPIDNPWVKQAVIDQNTADAYQKYLAKLLSQCPPASPDDIKWAKTNLAKAQGKEKDDESNAISWAKSNSAPPPDNLPSSRPPTTQPTTGPTSRPTSQASSQ